MGALVVFGLAIAHPAGVFGPVGRAFAEGELPPSRQVVIIMRALAYDGNLKTRAGRAIDIAVLYKKGLSRSEQMAATMAKAFGALSTTQVAGLPITVSRLGYGGGEALGKSIDAGNIDLVYVCDGLEGDLPAIAEVTRRAHALTVGSRQDHVHGGLSLGVFQTEEKVIILLNLQASRQEGAAFAADLLRLASVIR
jgi:hypothetical protein